MKRRINESDRTGPQAAKQFNDRDGGSRRAHPKGCFREKLADYSSENTLLRRQPREDQGPGGTGVCSDWCAICFRRRRSEGNNFGISVGIRNAALQNFGFWLTTASKAGRRCWTTGIIACERSNAARKIQ